MLSKTATGLAWGALAVALACSAAVSAPAPSAPVLAKIADAYGGRTVLDSIKTNIEQLSLTSQGQDTAVSYTHVLPDKFLEVVSIPALHVMVTTGYDGKTVWQKDSYGHVAALTGDRLATALCQANDPMDAILRPATSKAAVAVKPDQTLDGKKYIVLLISQAGCPSTTLYVDPKTYLVARWSNDLQTTDFSNYQTGPAGEKYPKSIVLTTPEGTAIATVTSEQDNVTVDPSIFAMPPGSPAPTPSAGS